MSRSQLVRIAGVGAAVLTAVPFTVSAWASGPLDFQDGQQCTSYATPDYSNAKLEVDTGTTSTGCEYRSTVAAGFQATGGFRLSITRAGHTYVLAAKNGTHCGVIGTIRKGDWVAAYAESSTLRVSTLKTGPNAHC